MDPSETDDESLIGEACHIVGDSVNGPRGHAPLPIDQRNKFANLILLCNIHHKLVDDQPNTYPIERLQAIKADHEAWVRAQLNFDAQKQRDDEIYAEYVERWATTMRLNEWMQWASSLVSHGQPLISAEMKKALEEIRPWLLSRVWPCRYSDLEAAFLNFRLVAQDLCKVFGEYAEPFGDDAWHTRKFYQIPEWDPERYERLGKKFDDHVDLVEDLTLELTRAANYICDMVRRRLMPGFRIEEGVALIQSGPHMDLSYKTYRLEYRGGSA